MWVIYFFLSYLILALTIPTCWALVPIWRRARTSRQVTCPAASHTAIVDLDPWYAVRMHALGNQELRVKEVFPVAAEAPLRPSLSGPDRRGGVAAAGSGVT